MNFRRSILSIVLASLLIVNIAAFLPTLAQTTELYVDPALSSFTSDTTVIGDTFTVDINVADVTNLFAYEFKLMFNSDLLAGLGASRPAGHFLEPTDPLQQFIPVWTLNTYNATHEYYHLGFTLLAPQVARSGSGTLVEVEFQILVDPPWGGDVGCPLDLYDTKLADDTATPITHTAIDGEYLFTYAAPTTYPYLSVVPSLTTIPAGSPIVGTGDAYFTVEVYVNDLLPAWWVVGIEFKMAFNDTLIDYVSDINTTWLDTMGPAVYKVPTIDGGDFIHTAVALLPNWTAPISGTGPIVEITFEVIYQEAFPWFASSPLDLYDVKFADILADPVTQEPEVDGEVVINGFLIGRIIDLYTQYPYPYGGQGPHQPSDMFWPQKEVELCVNVTYNLWPVQNKLVAFEVRDPSGALVTILTATSDVDGVACTTFRIPWPCDDPESLFGIWEVTATVDIACVVVNDTLKFHFDYLVRWIKITTDKEEYAHCEDIIVTVEYQSFAMMQYDVLLTAVLHDELNYPIDYAYLWVTVGEGMGMEGWCTYKNYTDILTMHVLKHAVAGVATIYVNAYSDWPTAGGSAWVPETSIEVNILAEWA